MGRPSVLANKQSSSTIFSLVIFVDCIYACFSCFFADAIVCVLFYILSDGRKCLVSLNDSQVTDLLVMTVGALLLMCQSVLYHSDNEVICT